MGRSKWTIEKMVMRPFNWKWFEGASHFAKYRWIKNAVPWFRKSGLNVFFIPINESIELSDNTPVPVEALYDIIDKTSHRVIVDKCLCRATLKCKKYPEDIGCLMMGKSALEINKDISREVSPQEAKRHVEKAMSSGLTPFMGKARVDNFVFGIRNNKQLFSVCFCCECCSISRFARHLPPEIRAENLNMFQGLKMEIGEECNGCGVCEGICFLRVISIDGGKAVIGEGCVGCGRCATACKRKAISMKLENPYLIENVRTHLEKYIDIY